MIKTNISAKNIELNDALREFIDKKIASIERMHRDDTATELRIEISKPSRHHRSGPVFVSEFNLKIGGKLLRAVAQHEDLHSAITEAKDDLQIQIKKFKEKKTELERQKKWSK